MELKRFLNEERERKKITVPPPLSPPARRFVAIPFNSILFAAASASPMASRLRLGQTVPNQASTPDPGQAKELEGGEARKPEPKPPEVTVLGGGSEVWHIPRFMAREAAWEVFEELDKRIPWTRPTIRVFGRASVQVAAATPPFITHFLAPRPGSGSGPVTDLRFRSLALTLFRIQNWDTCYVADEGLTDLKYSGHQPRAHSWDEFPVLKDILKAVHEALPGSYFNSLLLNRYKAGSDYVSWHADDEPLYGPTPEIASVTFGCEREFLLRKKPAKTQAAAGSGESVRKRLKIDAPQQHSFLLKHGSLLVMRGYTQHDWQHSVPKRAKAASTRINLTFRQVLS
ncbi:hypothetical protein ACQ4PT_009180 [Festuca glaucescens]